MAATITATEVPPGYGIPTPPASDATEGKSPFFPLREEPQKSAAALESQQRSASKPTSPTSPLNRRVLQTRIVIDDHAKLEELIPMVAEANGIRLSDVPASPARSSTDSTSGSNKKRRRKGVPRRSPNRDEPGAPGMIFSFPAVFPQNAAPKAVAVPVTAGSESVGACLMPSPAPSTVTSPAVGKAASNGSGNINGIEGQVLNGPIEPSATVIYHPLLLPQLLQQMDADAASKARARPATRANKRNAGERRPLMPSRTMTATTPTMTTTTKPVTMVSAHPSMRTMRTMHTPGRFMIRGIRPGGSPAFPFMRRRSSVSSDSSVPSTRYTSSDEDEPSMSNSDHSADDEDDGDDADFEPAAKRIKVVGAGLGITLPTNALPTHGHAQPGPSRASRDPTRQKICASCRTKSTPCWRPGWSPELFLCNSCGLRYKKTKCVCPNTECRYIPLKSEYNAMFRRGKNGEINEAAKRCCKCQTEL